MGTFCPVPLHTLFFPPVFCFLLLASSCSNDLGEAEMITSRANVNIETGKDVEIHYSDNGVTRIVAKGNTVTRHITQKPYMEFRDGMELIFYNNEGKVESKMTARYATVLENSNEMTARDSVVVINEKGERLDTDELIWDEQKKIIYSNTFVKITTADEIILGKGMTANQNFTDYVVKSISGTIKVNASEVE